MILEPVMMNAGIIPPEPDGKWYWIGDPTPGRDGTVQVPPEVPNQTDANFVLNVVTG